MFHGLENALMIPVMQFQLQCCPVSACFGGLQDAIKDILPRTISSTSARTGPGAPSVVRQQGVRHQVDRL